VSGSEQTDGHVTSPVELRDGRLVVHGRRGEVVTFPTSGKGAVAALAPYRFHVDRDVSGSTRGARRDRTRGRATAFAGRSFSIGHERTYERGVALLDGDGWVLHRLYGLPRRDLKRFAAAHGLDYWDETLTDREALEAAPELWTGRWAGLPPRTAGLATLCSTVVAVIVSIGVYLATTSAVQTRLVPLLIAAASLIATRILLDQAATATVPKLILRIKK
jgi:hypothetical protein